MDLDLVIAQLKGFAPSFGGRIAGAAAFKGIPENTALEVPCAFVLPLSDDPEPPTSQNVVRQKLVDGFAVVVAVSNKTDERGQSAATALEARRRELWKALLGWRPTMEYDGVQYDGGSLQSMDRFQVFYMYEFGAAMEIGPEDGWEEGALERLPDFKTMHVNVDIVDPAADKNIKYPGPDGRIEHQVQIDNLDQ